MSAGKKIRDRPRFRDRGPLPISAPVTRGARATERGFTYLALLIAVAVGGGVLAAVGEWTSHAQQREKEAELLFAGHQYRQAIGAYYERSPGGAKRYPQKLEDMLEDARHLTPQRYLRKLFRDPVTGKSEWGLIEAPGGGGIMGVYSLAEMRPAKSGGFLREDESFADAASYADWKFFYTPRTGQDTSGGNPPQDAQGGNPTQGVPGGVPQQGIPGGSLQQGVPGASPQQSAPGGFPPSDRPSAPRTAK